MSEVRDLTHWTDWTDGELIDQAAGACQDRALLECDYVREAIALNVIAPFRQKLTTLRAENELMREALGYYRDHSCEGYCDGFTLRICQSIQDENLTGGDCYGCRAAIALAQVRG